MCEFQDFKFLESKNCTCAFIYKIILLFHSIFTLYKQTCCAVCSILCISVLRSGDFQHSTEILWDVRSLSFGVVNPRQFHYRYIIFQLRALRVRRSALLILATITDLSLLNSSHLLNRLQGEFTRRFILFHLAIIKYNA